MCCVDETQRVFVGTPTFWSEPQVSSNWPRFFHGEVCFGKNRWFYRAKVTRESSGLKAGEPSKFTGRTAEVRRFF